MIQAVGCEILTCFKFRMAQGLLPKSREALPEKLVSARMNPKYMCLCLCVCVCVCVIINKGGKM